MSEAKSDVSKFLSLSRLASKIISEKLFWTGTFDQYLKIVAENPLASESAHQRLYRSVMVHGSKPNSWLGIDHQHYNLFDDPIEDGKDAIFGLDLHLAKLVAKLRAAAERRGQEDRFLLLHGPVGSSKSTITRLLKKNLCWFTSIDEGQLYTHSWVVDSGDTEGHLILGLMDAISGHEAACPVHEDPFMLLPIDARREIQDFLNAQVLSKYGKGTDFPEDKYIEIKGTPCPFCRQAYSAFLAREHGDWRRVLERHLKIKRLIFSEEDRIGIGSFRPKDEKNQDSTEISGDINYRKIAQIGSESDPRAFNFDGESQVSNRGLFYIEEVCKLDKAFLYDFLGLTQEHEIKPKRFRVMTIDAVHIGSTNNPEFEKLLNDDTMEAFRDRTTRIDIPYIIRVSDEEKIYDRIYNSRNKLYNKGKHILAPHTNHVASMFAVATRVEDPENVAISLMQKVKAYDGHRISGITEQKIRELAESSLSEGMKVAVSPRYVQDMIGSARVTFDSPCVTPYMVLEALEKGLSNNSLVKGNSRIEAYKTLLSKIRQELDDMIREELQEVIGGDKDALTELWENYLKNLIAYVEKEKVYNEHTHEQQPPNERLMREIEGQIKIDDKQKDEFRSKIMRNIGAFAARNRKFDWQSDQELRNALRRKLFNDRKDWINLSKLNTGVMSKEDQGKLNVIKQRLITDFGYCSYCADVVLSVSSSVFSSGGNK